MPMSKRAAMHPAVDESLKMLDRTPRGHVREYQLTPKHLFGVTRLTVRRVQMKPGLASASRLTASI